MWNPLPFFFRVLHPVCHPPYLALRTCRGHVCTRGRRDTATILGTNLSVCTLIEGRECYVTRGRCRHAPIRRSLPAVMEMDVLPETGSGSIMSADQQQLFFKEASDASYRARSNLTPEQQVHARCRAAHTCPRIQLL